jgi:predicted RNA-binding Zn-ribbon protein involved in translation (DUF1610 family)
VYERREGTKPAARVDDERDYVEFWPSGAATSGWFLCAACGSTVIVRQVLPRCMHCGERLWERAQIRGVPASTAV